MKLHDAIAKLLHEKGALTPTQIADALNRLGWYKKGDGSPLKSSQIGARVKNYPSYFTKKDGVVHLKGGISGFEISKAPDLVKKTVFQSKVDSIVDPTLLEKVLMNEKNYKNAKDIDAIVPDEPGLYCIRIQNINTLPTHFREELIKRAHNILYIGIATVSLRKRFLGQELRAKGHGTFFRSIGALLGYQPEKGSLRDKANKRNYTFSTRDEQAIIHWINEHLLVQWVTFSSDFDALESILITRYLPLMNIAKNPQPSELLKALRAKCVEVANS